MLSNKTKVNQQKKCNIVILKIICCKHNLLHQHPTINNKIKVSYGVRNFIIPVNDFSVTQSSI